MKDIQSTGKVKALFLLMRPSQWVKNIILFLPMFFAQEIGDVDRLWNVAILFTGFCLLTSGVYVFNDLMDAGEDRRIRSNDSGRLPPGRFRRWQPLSSYFCYMG